MDPPRITLFSLPLVSTWVLDETHRVLFDVGDGAAAMLDGRIHRANTVALSHAHRDHIGGLAQFLNLRAGHAAADGAPLQIFHPEGSGTFLTLGRFLAQFDPQTTGAASWRPMRPGIRAPLGDDRFLEAFATNHLQGPDPNRIVTLGYRIGRQVERLKPELRGAPQAELDQLRRDGGRVAITVSEAEAIFVVSGDTTVISLADLAGARFLLHECTFLDMDEERCCGDRARNHDHTCLGDLLDLAAEANLQCLGLYHVSRRFTDEDIIRSIRAGCHQRGMKTRVSVALPGRLVSDLFSQWVWPPRG